jgi:GT2 family glycosyltransferase
MKLQVDVIIISFAKDENLRSVTESCVTTLLNSESKIQFNVIIVESNHLEKFKNLSNFKNVKIVYPTEQFGYNKYLNIGIKLTTSNYVCLCNNDLIFNKNWASKLIEAMSQDPQLLSVSPYSTNPHKTRFNLEIQDKVEYGYGIRRYLTGWCIFQKRKIYEQTGLFDERFTFWYADNDYSETIKKLGIKHALVLNSVVEHIESKTLNGKDSNTKRKLTIEQKKIFDLKWKNKR